MMRDLVTTMMVAGQLNGNCSEVRCEIHLAPTSHAKVIEMINDESLNVTVATTSTMTVMNAAHSMETAHLNVVTLIKTPPAVLIVVVEVIVAKVMSMGAAIIATMQVAEDVMTKCAVVCIAMVAVATVIIAIRSTIGESI